MHHLGHVSSECDANRMQVFLAAMTLEDLTPEQAWENVIKADAALGKDLHGVELLEDVKIALWTYIKATPQGVTWACKHLIRGAV